MATREHSPSDHLCQIVPDKRPSRAGTQPNARIVDRKATFHSQSDRDAIDQVKTIDGMTSQQPSEWQHVSVWKLQNQADRFRVRRAQLPTL